MGANDLRIVSQTVHIRRRDCHGWILPAKQTSDDRFGCPDESPAASTRPRSAFGVFLNPEFPLRRLRESPRGLLIRRGLVESSIVKLVIQFLLGLVVGVIALWWVVAELIENWFGCPCSCGSRYRMRSQRTARMPMRRLERMFFS